MDNLEALHQQLTNAGLSDDEIARGPRLTPTGKAKLCGKFHVGEDELNEMLRQLAKQVKGDTASTGLPQSPDIFEDDERFSYEADFMGNVTLRDSKTGKSHYLGGDDGQKFLHEVERVGHDFQGLIAPYFDDSLMEDDAPVVSLDAEINSTGGTYNFPFNGHFACARFWLDGNKPQVKVISIVDEAGEEVPLDAASKAEATRAAWEWVNKV